MKKWFHKVYFKILDKYFHKELQEKILKILSNQDDQYQIEIVDEKAKIVLSDELQHNLDKTIENFDFKMVCNVCHFIKRYIMFEDGEHLPSIAELKYQAKIHLKESYDNAVLNDSDYGAVEWARFTYEYSKECGFCISYILEEGCGYN